MHGLARAGLCGALTPGTRPAEKRQEAAKSAVEAAQTKLREVEADLQVHRDYLALLEREALEGKGQSGAPEPPGTGDESDMAVDTAVPGGTGGASSSRL